MADKFNVDEGTTGSGPSPASGVGDGKPGSDSGADSNAGTDSGVAGGNSSNETITARDPDNLTKLGTPRKRRPGGGRKPASGTDSGNTTDATNKGAGKRLDLKNDRAKVKTNIGGLHAIAAVLTKQPILNLNEKEAEALSNSLCDVADYHGINLMQTGGAFGLYASLATCCYMIYVPRIVAIKQTTVGISKPKATPDANDIAGTVNAGTVNYEADVIN